jgi:hypothetical protein
LQEACYTWNSNTKYECRFVISDPDDVAGNAGKAVTAHTRAEPKPHAGGRVFHVYQKTEKEQKMNTKFLLACSFLLIVALLIPGGIGGKRAATSTPMSQASLAKEGSVLAEYDVVSPIGKSHVKQITQAPRLQTLAGKTIAVVSDNVFKSWITAPLVEKLLKEKYPTAKVIPDTELKEVGLYPAPGTSSAALEAFVKALKANHVDAVITGNGG